MRQNEVLTVENFAQPVSVHLIFSTPALVGLSGPPTGPPQHQLIYQGGFKSKLQEFKKAKREKSKDLDA